MEAKTIEWPGQSGACYKYWIYPIGADFKAQAGNYIFAYESRPGYWSPAYIGQSVDLSQRLANHEVEAEARRCGATHIHAHLNNGTEVARCGEERDLIEKWNPVCNTQFTN